MGYLVARLNEQEARIREVSVKRGAHKREAQMLGLKLAIRLNAESRSEPILRFTGLRSFALP